MILIKNVHCPDCASFGKTCWGMLLFKDTPEERERLTNYDCIEKVPKTPPKGIAG